MGTLFGFINILGETLSRRQGLGFGGRRHRGPKTGNPADTGEVDQHKPLKASPHIVLQATHTSNSNGIPTTTVIFPAYLTGIHPSCSACRLSDQRPRRLRSVRGSSLVGPITVLYSFCLTELFDKPNYAKVGVNPPCSRFCTSWSHDADSARISGCLMAGCLPSSCATLPHPPLTYSSMCQRAPASSPHVLARAHP